MNNKFDKREKILEIFESIIEVEHDSITSSQTFEDLGINSITFIRLVVQCETDLNIEFEDEMLVMTKYPDVDTFIKYIIDRIESM